MERMKPKGHSWKVNSYWFEQPNGHLLAYKRNRTAKNGEGEDRAAKEGWKYYSLEKNELYENF